MSQSNKLGQTARHPLTDAEIREHFGAGLDACRLSEPPALDPKLAADLEAIRESFLGKPKGCDKGKKGNKSSAGRMGS
jgi:hypothetical protein